MEVIGVIYLIWNLVNGKRYVGQTTQPLKKRFDAHARDKKNPIDRDIQEYGREKFRYGVIKSCTSKEELDYWEKYFIAALKSKAPYGYNRTCGGTGHWRHTKETCLIIAAKLRGVKKSPAHCANISKSKLGEKNPNYGKPLSDEQKAKISLKLTGMKKNLDFNGEKNPFFGKHHTNSTRTHLSAIRRGNSPYKNLIAEMDAHQLSHAMLAQLLGLSREAVSMKIRGERNFTDKDKANLEEIFGKPAAYLLQRFD